MGIDNVLLMVPRVNFNNSIKKRKEIIVLLNVVFLAHALLVAFRYMTITYLSLPLQSSYCGFIANDL